ncbi:hypothetical protein PLICRDRAFT_180304 [Plicaturopsis crispa FD-325 SS-3]|uniref:Uncharacterized protein n=1 Tax=Plicaturopsis crispa FD-325 SS-3 TaxID=944288 RepID=A0A0C9SQA6_PLICR|nr:hypothetical protein PLICRDRAFT_180304 [Plicaturopsis crispa FD-325 SS-3]
MSMNSRTRPNVAKVVEIDAPPSWVCTTLPANDIGEPEPTHIFYEGLSGDAYHAFARRPIFVGKLTVSALQELPEPAPDVEGIRDRYTVRDVGKPPAPLLLDPPRHNAAVHLQVSGAVAAHRRQMEVDEQASSLSTGHRRPSQVSNASAGPSRRSQASSSSPQKPRSSQASTSSGVSSRRSTLPSSQMSTSDGEGSSAPPPGPVRHRKRTTAQRTAAKRAREAQPYPVEPHVQRDKWRDPETDLMPAVPQIWQEALNEVVRDKDRLEPNRPRKGNGYRWPEAALFATTKNKGRFLVNWLAGRQAWMAKQTTEVDRVGTQQMANKESDDYINELVSSKHDAPATKYDIMMVLNAMLEGQNELKTLIQTSSSRNAGGSPNPPATPSRRGARIPEVPDFTPKHRDSTITDLQVQIRRHTKILMDRVLPTDAIPTAPEAVVLVYQLGGKGGPTLHDFRIDVTGVSTPWNKRLAEIFAADFVSKTWHTCKDEELVATKFMSHIPHLRALHRQPKHKDKGDEDGDGSSQIEDDDEATERKRDTRRRGLRSRRAEASTVHPDVHQFEDLWKIIPHDAMSGDETDKGVHSGRARYVITTLDWRSQAALTWLRAFDKLHLSTRFRGSKAKAGNFPHYWVPSRRAEQDCVAPRGLPQNFYDEIWLSRLDDDERRRLKMRPAVDLTLSESVLRFRDVTSPQTPPLPKDDPSLNTPAATSAPVPSGSGKPKKSAGRKMRKV